MLAISSVLLAGALSSGAQAQSFPAVFNLDSLDGTNGFRFDGTAESGRSVASAGDINGDGIDDLIIGSKFASPNDVGNAGASYVVFGKDTSTAGHFAAELEASSLDGSNGFRLDGQGSTDYSGSSVAAAGDINGDGIDDLVIGAPKNGGIDQGGAYVVFGKNTAIAGNNFPATLALSGLNGTNGFRLAGQGNNTRIGISVAAAGDFNGDGTDDVAIGAGFAMNGVFVFSSKDAAPDGNFLAEYPLVEFVNYQFFFTTSDTDSIPCDCSVASAGDVNNDGIDDLIVGSLSTLAVQDSSYVVFGTPTIISTILEKSDLDGTNGFRLQVETGYAGFGRSVSSAGDINGDGIDDMIVGALYTDPDGRTNAGSSYVVFGKDTGIAGNFPATLSVSSLDGLNGFRLDGVSSEDDSGFSVASAGDINGDGIDDLIIGAPGADRVYSRAKGRCYVVFGKDTAIAGNGFPAVLALSDLDGSNGFRLDGTVVSGGSRLDGTDVSDRAPIGFGVGRSVAAAGDVNGDGIDDLILGAPDIDGNPDTPSADGGSYVVFGGISGPGLIPRVALDTNTLEFGDIALGDTAVRTLIVENSGTGTLIPGALSITGAQAGEFSIELNNCASAQLAADVSCSIDIGFTPTAPGVRQATLDLQSNAPSSPAPVQLRGSNDVEFADGFEGN